LRDNEGLTGDKALRNMSYFLILKLIEPRLGKEIDIDNSNEGWDGRTGGINVAPGVYLYTIELEYIDGRKEWVTGDVLVVSQ
jgi:hypothetical protein